MQKQLDELPKSSDKYWDGADVRSVRTDALEKPDVSGLRFRRQGQTAVIEGKSFDGGMYLDWRKYKIADGKIVVK